MENIWPSAPYIAFGLYLIAALTDFLDGKIARSWSQVTPLGAFLDPIADKIFVVSLLLVFADSGRISGFWMIAAILIVVREFTISGLREFLGPHNIQMPVSKLAKWKTAFQMIAVGLLIIGPSFSFGLLIGQWTLTIAAILSIITAMDYLKVGLRHLNTLSKS